MGDAVCDLNMNLINNLSNVELVHLKCGNNMSKNDDVQLTLQKLKFNNGNHISRHQFVGASLLLMTTCLLIFKIPKCHQSNKQLVTFQTNLIPLKKNFIKYNKTNNIIPMKTHIDSTHPHLITKIKL